MKKKIEVSTKVAQVLADAKDIINNKADGIVYIIKRKEDNGKVLLEGLKVIHNMPHEELVQEVVDTFELDPFQVLALKAFKN